VNGPLLVEVRQRRCSPEPGVNVILRRVPRVGKRDRRLHWACRAEHQLLAPAGRSAYGVVPILRVIAFGYAGRKSVEFQFGLPDPACGTRQPVPNRPVLRSLRTVTQIATRYFVHYVVGERGVQWGGELRGTGICRLQS